MHEGEKSKWSCSVMSDPQRPHGLQPTRLLRPWDFPGKSTGVGCHCLLHRGGLVCYNSWGRKELDTIEWLNWTELNTVKCFNIVSEAKLDIFLEFPCFLYDPMDIRHLISGFSDFSKSSLYIWKFLAHILTSKELPQSVFNRIFMDYPCCFN